MSSPCCAGTDIPPELCSLTSSLKVIAEEHRLKILCILRDSDHCVCEILPALDLPQNLASHHLKVLRDADFISSRKDGQKVFYSLNHSTIDQVITMLNQHFTKEK